MSQYVLAGAGVALLSLIFSDLPFVQLVYFLAITQVMDWQTFATVTGIMMIASVGGTIYRKFKS